MKNKYTKRAPISIAISSLMTLSALSFLVASIIHIGVVFSIGPIVIHDPFKGAAIPEFVIAVVLATGSFTIIIRKMQAWRIAFGTVLFALLVTTYGLTITIRTSRYGDIIYHFIILTVLILIVSLLLLPSSRKTI